MHTHALVHFPECICVVLLADGGNYEAGGVPMRPNSNAHTHALVHFPDCMCVVLLADGGDDEAGGAPMRPTVTRVTPNSLELHKIKEQERRAREKQLLAKLQVFTFDFVKADIYFLGEYIV